MTEAPVLSPDHPFVDDVVEALRAVYGERLAGAALYGSVARRTARPDSDLDLLVIVSGLPARRRERLRTFDEVERRLAPKIAALGHAGISTRLSPVLRTPEDLRTATPLMLDLTEDAVVLLDPAGVIARALDDLRQRLRRAGARRIWVGTRWYWDLKPDFRRGDTVRI